MELIDIFERLHNQPSPSGQEQSIQTLVKELVLPLVDSASLDIHGNLVCLKKAKQYDKAKTIMLIAHVDEVGLMISHIEDSGFIRFTNIGGVDTSILKGRAVSILHNNELIPGVIGCKPVHMKERGDKDIDISDLWIDIGASDYESALENIAIGDSVVLDSVCRHFPNNLITGRGCDDKVGVAVLIKVLEHLSKSPSALNVVFVSSVQEEVGLRGATTSAYNVDPDICIAVDVAHATDYPGINKAKYGNVKLGKGAVIPYGTDLTIRIQKLLTEIAKEESISYQVLAQPGSTGTDAHAVQVSRGGCASGLVSIPCRYMHSPSEVVSIDDLKSAVRIISLFSERCSCLYE